MMGFLELVTVSKEGQVPIYINLDNLNSFTVDNLSKDSITKSLIYMNGGQIIHVIEDVEEIKKRISLIYKYMRERETIEVKE